MLPKPKSVKSKTAAKKRDAAAKAAPDQQPSKPKNKAPPSTDSAVQKLTTRFQRQLKITTTNTNNNNNTSTGLSTATPTPETSPSTSTMTTTSTTSSLDAFAPCSSLESVYFETYSRLRIHESMLKDRIRTLTYRDAIVHNKHLFKDKIVLDVGCGTGILSLFAARAGARRVYAVDCADIAPLAAQVVTANRLEHIITVIHAKIEHVQLPVAHVDIIISEWMGYCLLFESMLDSVLFARDKWLRRPGGLLFPDYAALFVSGVSSRARHAAATECWSRVCGGEFDMRAMRAPSLREGRVLSVEPEEVATDVFRVREFDLMRVRAAEVREFAQPFRLRMAANGELHGVEIHFTVEFRCCHRPILLTTAPQAPLTHWKQTVFFFGEALPAKRGETVYGMFRLGQNREHHRSMDVGLDVVYRGDYGAVQWVGLQYCVQ